MKRTHFVCSVLSVVLTVAVLTACDPYEVLYSDCVLTITNESRFLISEVYCTQDTEWGHNRIRSVVSPGQSAEVAVPKGIYNVKVVFVNGLLEEIVGLDVSSWESYEVKVR